MKISKLLSLILILSVILSGIVFGEEAGVLFLKLPHSSMGTGLGEAVTSLDMSSEGVFWNPASIAGEERISVSFSYASLVQDFSLNNLNFIYPHKSWGNFGLGVSFFNQGRISETTIYEPDGTGDSISSNDISINLVYSRVFLERLKMGLCFKYFNSQLGGETCSGLAFGLGSIYSLNQSLSFGIWFNNLGSGVKYISESDPLPFQARLGSSYKISNYIFSLDTVYDLEEGFGIALGTELNVYKDMFKFRLGYKSYDSANPYGIGINVNYSNFSIDYAYVPISQKGLYDFNQVSISYKF